MCNFDLSHAVGPRSEKLETRFEITGDPKGSLSGSTFWLGFEAQTHRGTAFTKSIAVENTLRNLLRSAHI